MIGEILLVQKNLRHSSTLKVDVGILEIKKKDGIEETNCCIFNQKNLLLSWKLKKTTGYVDEFTNL